MSGSEHIFNHAVFDRLLDEAKSADSSNTIELSGKCLKFLQLVRDGAPTEWEALMRTSVGTSLCALWDTLKAHEKEKEHSVKIRWGQSPDDSYTEEHPYDEYKFGTVAELNACWHGAGEANGWLDMHEYAEEKTNE